MLQRMLLVDIIIWWTCCPHDVGTNVIN